MEPGNEPYRCFVTAIIVNDASRNRFAGTVHFKQDHGGPVRDKGTVTGSFDVCNADYYSVGDVVNVSIS